VRDSTNPRSSLSLNILVPEAHAVGAIAAIRSLGSAGHQVHACATNANALGLSSKLAAHSVVCPDYGDGDFIPWLRDYVREHDVGAIVPSEAFLLAMRPAFSEFSHLLPVPRDEELVYRALSKYDAFHVLRGAPGAEHIPPTLFVSDDQPLPSRSDLETLGAPLYIKVDGCHARGREGSAIHKVLDAKKALHLIEDLLARFRKVLVQGHVPGIGAGVYFLLRDGEIQAEFMNLCLHEVPHTGGLCTLRESWFHPDMREDALGKLRHLGWNGVAMMEYRWDPAEQRFYFIEMNARFWAALHLALYAGVDFPKLLIESFLGREVHARTGYPVGMKCRWTVPGEVGYVASRLRDSDLSLWSRLWPLAEFFLLFFDPRTKSDLLFPGDRNLYWLQWKRFLADLFGVRARK